MAAMMAEWTAANLVVPKAVSWAAWMAVLTAVNWVASTVANWVENLADSAATMAALTADC